MDIMSDIDFDVSVFQRWLSLFLARVTRLSGNDIVFVLLAVIIPPLAVWLKVGLTFHFWINLVLTLLGFVPGQIHALWIVLFL